MRNLFKNVNLAAAAVITFSLVLLVLGLVALIRCPATDIPDVIRAFGTWVHISLRA
jgi:hypothetical protein